MSSHKSSDNNTVELILTFVGLIAVAAVIRAMVKDVKKNTSSDVVSEEGKEILGDARKREKLQKAVDHYREEGNWDLLHKVGE